MLFALPADIRSRKYIKPSINLERYAMELQLTDKDFQKFRTLIYKKSGINLHEGKKELLKARLAKYLRGTNFTSLEQFYSFLQEGENNDYLIELLDCISTNLTYFFREPKHYEFLKTQAIPYFLDQYKSGKLRKLKIWSAGCSSGEEPYSIAFTIMEYFGSERGPLVKILATDISTKMLAKAKSGIYPEECLKDIPLPIKRKYFKKGVNKWSGYYRVKDEIRKQIVFKRFNLIEPFPPVSFHVVFCRNVMIYFDKTTQEKIVNKFYNVIRPGGYLFIGHSESLASISHGFKYIQPSVYRK